MENYSIFITEADPGYGERLTYYLGLNPDYKVKRFLTAKECLAQLHLKPDLITIDFSLPDMSGEDLYKKIKTICPEVPVIVISSMNDINIAVNLLKLGVNDYLMKDETTQDILWKTIISIREKQRLLKKENLSVQSAGQQISFKQNFIGEHESLKKVFTMMEKATRTSMNVFLAGETGTGKEVVAQSIHFNSERSKNNFVAVNMAAIPRELIESELFGHEKGAFTGAINKKTGKFEEANGGTIFLDEIGDMDLDLQCKLLRVLQERTIVKVGGHHQQKVDVRVIIATHKNLPELIKAGKFREDLYYRLMGLPIELPPLKERGNDIIILANYFIEKFSKENKLGSIILTKEAKNKLLNYSYPGNIRELKSVIELAAILCDHGAINAGDINFPDSGVSEVNFIMEEKTLRDYTNDIVRYFLNKYNNNVIATADKLGIGKSTIYKLLQQK